MKTREDNGITNIIVAIVLMVTIKIHSMSSMTMFSKTKVGHIMTLLPQGQLGREKVIILSMKSLLTLLIRSKELLLVPSVFTVDISMNRKSTCTTC